ncbi:hypothetical protein [Rickettsia endosymbiont of Ceutorhynchus obstrictus]
MTFLYFLDSRLRGNDIGHFFRAMQQSRLDHGIQENKAILDLF